MGGREKRKKKGFVSSVCLLSYFYLGLASVCGPCSCVRRLLRVHSYGFNVFFKRTKPKDKFFRPAAISRRGYMENLTPGSQKTRLSDSAGCGPSPKASLGGLSLRTRVSGFSWGSGLLTRLAALGTGFVLVILVGNVTSKVFGMSESSWWWVLGVPLLYCVLLWKAVEVLAILQYRLVVFFEQKGCPFMWRCLRSVWFSNLSQRYDCGSGVGRSVTWPAYLGSWSDSAHIIGAVSQKRALGARKRAYKDPAHLRVSAGHNTPGVFLSFNQSALEESLVSLAWQARHRGLNLPWDISLLLEFDEMSKGYKGAGVVSRLYQPSFYTSRRKSRLGPPEASATLLQPVTVERSQLPLGALWLGPNQSQGPSVVSQGSGFAWGGYIFFKLTPWAPKKKRLLSTWRRQPQDGGVRPPRLFQMLWARYCGAQKGVISLRANWARSPLRVYISSGQGYVPGRGLLVEGKVYGEIISHRVAYGFSRFGAFVAPDSDVGYPTFCLAVYGDALNESVESVPGLPGLRAWFWEMREGLLRAGPLWVEECLLDNFEQNGGVGTALRSGWGPSLWAPLFLVERVRQLNQIELLSSCVAWNLVYSDVGAGAPSQLPNILLDVGVGQVLVKILKAYARLTKRPSGALTFLVLPLISPGPIQHDLAPGLEWGGVKLTMHGLGAPLTKDPFKLRRVPGLMSREAWRAVAELQLGAWSCGWHLGGRVLPRALLWSILILLDQVVGLSLSPRHQRRGLEKLWSRSAVRQALFLKQGALISYRMLAFLGQGSRQALKGSLLRRLRSGLKGYNAPKAQHPAINSWGSQTQLQTFFNLCAQSYSFGHSSHTAFVEKKLKYAQTPLFLAFSGLGSFNLGSFMLLQLRMLKVWPLYSGASVSSSTWSAWRFQEVAPFHREAWDLRLGRGGVSVSGRLEAPKSARVYPCLSSFTKRPPLSTPSRGGYGSSERVREAYLKGLLSSKVRFKPRLQVSTKRRGVPRWLLRRWRWLRFLTREVRQTSTGFGLPDSLGEREARPTLDILGVVRLAGPHWRALALPPTGGEPVLSPAKGVPWLKNRLSWSLSSGPKVGKGGHRVLAPSNKWALYSELRSLVGVKGRKAPVGGGLAQARAELGVRFGLGVGLLTNLSWRRTRVLFKPILAPYILRGRGQGLKGWRPSQALPPKLRANALQTGSWVFKGGAPLGLGLVPYRQRLLQQRRASLLDSRLRRKGLHLLPYLLVRNPGLSVLSQTTDQVYRSTLPALIRYGLVTPRWRFDHRKVPITFWDRLDWVAGAPALSSSQALTISHAYERATPGWGDSFLSIGEVWHVMEVLSQSSGLFMYDEFREGSSHGVALSRWAFFVGSTITEVGVQNFMLYSPFKQHPLTYYAGSMFYPTPFRHIRPESEDNYDMCRIGKWDFDIETRRVVVSEFNGRFGWEPFSKGVYQYKGFSIPNYERYILCDLPSLESFIKYAANGSGVSAEFRRYSGSVWGRSQASKKLRLPTPALRLPVASWKARYGVYHGVGLPRIVLKRLRRACLDAAQDFDLKSKAYWELIHLQRGAHAGLSKHRTSPSQWSRFFDWNSMILGSGRERYPPWRRLYLYDLPLSSDPPAFLTPPVVGSWLDWARFKWGGGRQSSFESLARASTVKTWAITLSFWVVWVSLCGLRVSADMGPAFLRNRPGLARTQSLRKSRRCVPTSNSSKKTDVWGLGEDPSGSTLESAWHVDPSPLIFEWDWESFSDGPSLFFLIT